MNVIRRKTLQAFWEKKGNAAAQILLLEWFKIARKAHWHNFAEVRAVRGDADVARVASGEVIARAEHTKHREFGIWAEQSVSL